MYLEFYGLLEKPFSLTPDPKFFFASGGHAEARDLLRYGVREREGFMCFMGPAGTGKTILLRTVLESFGDDVVTALVLNPYLSETDLLRLILVDFGVVTREQIDSVTGRQLTKQDLVSRLNRHLLELSMQGRTAVLVIDEAQNLPLPVMEQIRLLSNLETAKSKLLQIVLAGQLGLRSLLATPELSQLAQRISVRYTLREFSFEDIRRYVDHRLRIAGSDGDIVFDDGALQRVLQYSEGVPRLVNLICDRALLAGYAQRTTRISASIVDRAAETLDFIEPGTTPVERAAPQLGNLQAQPRRPRPTRNLRQAPAVAPQAPRATSTAVQRIEFKPTISHLVGGVAMAAAAIVVALMVAPWYSAQKGLRSVAMPRAEATQTLSPGSSTSGAHYGAGAVGHAAPQPIARPVQAFTVYLSSFRQVQDGQLVALQERLAAADYVSFLLGADVPGQGRLQRLVVGDYQTQKAAQDVANRLRQEFGVAHAEVVAVADVIGG